MASHAHAHSAPAAGVSGDTAKDPICGMMVGKAGALAAGLTVERNARIYYFRIDA